MSRRTPEVGRTPLTDPRSLGGSVLFHAALLLVASLIVLGSVLPGGRPAPRALVGELGPVDNRAPAEEAGGGPGELGGQSTPESVRIAAEGRPTEGTATR